MVFGCSAYVHVPSDERSKLDPKSKQYIFLGYKKGVKGYKFWDPVARKMVISRDAVFDEQSMLQQHQDKMPKVGSSSNTLQIALKQLLVATENRGSTYPTSGDLVAIESAGGSHPTSGGSTTNELQAYNLARDRQRCTNEKKEWMGVMVEEMESCKRTILGELVQLSAGKKVIGCKWVYRKKPAVSEKKGKKFKARLVAKEYSQQKGIDYDEIFSPVVRHISIKNMHHVLALKALLSQKFDTKDLDVATEILGMEIHKDRGSRKLWLSERGYIEKVAVGCLMYTTMCTRPDLAHALLDVDSDYAGDLDDRRSTTGLSNELGVEQGGV
ncbi:UNVERIFIED_CONTAM: Retrovirus-related Pol polyprotein from transposon TNT 1-94 [Sesamum calycinum]|uniref:Retrovirus-related Pol polyprotein from transposon TNT 1-94 n=1 Tax=Sesamum calycinum TaxID=2727403 RepID=A0AAW2RSJ4_9LAMI